MSFLSLQCSSLEKHFLFSRRHENLNTIAIWGKVFSIGLLKNYNYVFRATIPVKTFSGKVCEIYGKLQFELIPHIESGASVFQLLRLFLGGRKTSDKTDYFRKVFRSLKKIRLLLSSFIFAFLESNFGVEHCFGESLELTFLKPKIRGCCSIFMWGFRGNFSTNLRSGKKTHITKYFQRFRDFFRWSSQFFWGVWHHK